MYVKNLEAFNRRAKPQCLNCVAPCYTKGVKGFVKSVRMRTVAPVARGKAMTEREGVLSNAPLIYTLSVIRFAPVLLLPKLIPEIHQAIRGRLPGFFQMVRGGMPGMPQGGEPNSWAFLDRDAQYACVLAQDHMILQSTAYKHFGIHLELFRHCVEAVVNHTGPLDVAGIGMRYVDKIEPQEGESLRDYLPETLLPLNLPEIANLKGNGATAPLGVSTTTYHFRPEFLHIRCWRQPGMWIPDDLAEAAMVFQIAKQASQQTLGNRSLQGEQAFAPLGEDGALLDTDAYWPLPLTERLPVNEICERLDGLHKLANSAFRIVASEHAFNAWNKKL